ncbi:MAG: Ig-like domain-containing protein [Saprospiraceae bacterium]|nr:hypothetical protein [Lewinella sp.]
MRSIFLIIVNIFFCLQGNAQEAGWALVRTSAGQYEITLSTQEERPVAEDKLRIYVGEHTEMPGDDYPSVLGKVTWEPYGYIFQPTFSFRPGVTYTAFLGPSFPFSFTIPSIGVRPELIGIYPSVEEVPANLLKIYLHFSTPMGEGRAYEHLVLTNLAGDTIQQPFVPLQPELWSDDRRRLTLWLDPGRVKRGLLSHETHGVVLAEGGTYQLTILPEWKDVNGNSLGRSFEKQFRVTTPDYRQPDPDQWSLETPRAGSMEPLTIQFGETMDHALVQRQIRVLDDGDQPVAGSVRLSGGDTVWQFVPENSWRAGHYSICIDTDLEDLAGNNLNRPFDRELKKAADEKVKERDFIRLEVEIVPSN